jgi:hypothetical protein
MRTCSTTTRILSAVTICLLSGCASPNVYKGLAGSTCSGPGSAAGFGSGACRSGAEYDTARKKVRNSQESTAADKDDELEEVIPLDASYKRKTP